MKKLFILVLSISILQLSALAQSSAVYSFGDSTKSIVGDAGFIDVDGNYVMMGRRSSIGNHFAKFNANHELQWSFYIPISMVVQGWRMFQTSNKDYIAIHSTGFSAYIVRISSNGNLLWSRTLGQISSMHDGLEWAGDLYFLGAWNDKSIVTKLDANGNEIWCKKIVTGDAYHRGIAINRDINGDLMLAGFAGTSGSVPARITLAKINTSGQLLSGYTYSDPSLNLLLSDMEISTLGGASFLTGHSYNAIGAYDINTTEAFVMKIGTNGSVQSAKNFGGNKEDKFTAICQIPGATFSLFVLSGFSKTPTGATKLLLSTVDNNGDFIKYSTYGDQHGNGFFFDQINYDLSHGINVMGTGSGFYVANASEYQFARFDTSLNLPCKAYNLTLTESNINLMAATGNFVISNHSLTYDSSSSNPVIDSITAFNSCTGDSINPTPLSLGEDVVENIKIFPNPVYGHLTINSGDSRLESIRILDMQGAVQFEKKNPMASERIETFAWPSAIYVLQIKLSSGSIVHRKIVVR